MALSGLQRLVCHALSALVFAELRLTPSNALHAFAAANQHEIRFAGLTRSHLICLVRGAVEDCCMARVMLFDLSLLTELNLSSRCVRLRESIGYFRVAFIVRFDMSAFALSARY